MNVLFPIVAGDAGHRSLVRDRDSAILAAANLFSQISNAASASTPTVLRAAMETAFGASDATGAWDWKRPMRPARSRRSCSCANTERRCSVKPRLRLRGFPCWPRSRGCCRRTPAAPRRAQSFQQFSTPMPLGLAALTAAAITPDDRVLEPSAGTGLLAILAAERRRFADPQRTGRDPRRSSGQLFPAFAVTRFDARPDRRSSRAPVPSLRRADEPAILGHGAMSAAASPTPPTAILPRRWTVLPRRAVGHDHRR